jgi:hypothetical protein
MSSPPNCQLNRWQRIVNADICDRHVSLDVRAGNKRRQSTLSSTAC